jgi:ubiquinone/menaquinone biosynthesis C-methylase UbiE
MRTFTPWLIAASWMLTIGPLPRLAAQEAKSKEGGQRDSINKAFEDPDLDVGAFIKRFESESREVYARRAELLAVCGLRPGMAVADVGAGTGLFTFAMAEKVGPKGAVYAVEIAPGFLKHLKEQAEKRGYDEIVRPTRGGHETTNLPANSVDVAFVCDAYHHFERPGPMLASIHQALRPGGRVVLIDFDKHEGASDFVKGHARAEKEVYFREFEKAGFKKLSPDGLPTLKENFVAVFEKQPASGDRQ